MQAFKLFFRIVSKNKSAFLIYLGAFLGISLLFVSLSGPQPQDGFESRRARLTVVRHDEGAVGRALEHYLQSVTRPSDLAEDEGAQLDALYFGRTEYILTIPQDFTQRLMAGKDVPWLERRTGHDAMAQAQVELLISRFLSLAEVYRQGLAGISAEELAGRIQDGLDAQAEVRLLAPTQGESGSLLFYLRYYAYTVLSILVLCVSSVMLAVSKPEIRRRNAVSPLPMARQTLQMILASLLLALALWAILMAAGLAAFGGDAHPASVRLMMMVTLAHTLACLCLSFMLSTLIGSHAVQSAVANMVTLSLSFLSGVFVPQQLLGEGVRRVAAFLPTHWYIRAIDALSPALPPSAAALSYSREAILMQLGFSAAFLALALLGSKRRGMTVK